MVRLVPAGMPTLVGVGGQTPPTGAGALGAGCAVEVDPPDEDGFFVDCFAVDDCFFASSAFFSASFLSSARLFVGLSGFDKESPVALDDSLAVDEPPCEARLSIYADVLANPTINTAATNTILCEPRLRSVRKICLIFFCFCGRYLQMYCMFDVLSMHTSYGCRHTKDPRLRRGSIRTRMVWILSGELSVLDQCFEVLGLFFDTGSDRNLTSDDDVFLQTVQAVGTSAGSGVDQHAGRVLERGG